MLYHLSFSQIPCSLDPTFDSDGTLIVSTSRLAEHIIIQDDGKIVVACNPFGNGSAQIRRYNVDGTLDLSYGSSGTFTVTVAEVATRINGMVMYNNNIYICGTTTTNIGGTNTYPYTAAITTNGGYLSSFGISGVKKFTNLYTCEGIVMDNTGNIYISGSYNLDELYVLKTDVNGNPDLTYDGDGMALEETGDINRWYQVADIQLDNNNQVVITGKKMKANNGSPGPAFWNMMVMRFQTNGSLDNTFATGGIGLYNSDQNEFDEGVQIHVTPNNQYIVCGNTYDDVDYDYNVLKLNNNGSTDNSFGTNGWILNDLLNTNDMENNLNSALLPDGRILLTGNQGDGDTVYFSLLMLESDGSRDISFAPDGLFTHVFGVNNNSSSSGMAVDDNGKIVLGGYTRTCVNGTCGPLYMALSRYNSSFGPAGLAETKEENNILLYPNPAGRNEMIHLELESNEEITDLIIYNASGQVQNAGFMVQSNSLMATSAPSGTYFCKVTTQSGNSIIQFVIE